MAVTDIDELTKLDFNKQLAFAYLTCERLYPNYVYFSENYHLGTPEILRSAIDYVYDNLFDINIDQARIKRLIAKVEENIPEPAEYDTVLASSSMDACNVILESLDFLEDKKVSRLLDISTMATDTADMYIQEIENLDFNLDKLFNQKIASHPIMLKEVSTQKGIISYLLKIKQLEPSDISTLLQLQGNEGSLKLFSKD